MKNKTSRSQAVRLSSNSIAAERCSTLIDLARKEFAKRPNFSNRYIVLARKIAMRHRLSLGSKDFCKNCNTVFIAGNTLTVRLNSSQKNISYRCNVCKKVRKFGYRLQKSTKSTQPVQSKGFKEAI